MPNQTAFPVGLAMPLTGALTPALVRVSTTPVAKMRAIIPNPVGDARHPVNRNLPLSLRTSLPSRSGPDAPSSKQGLPAVELTDILLMINPFTGSISSR